MEIVEGEVLQAILLGALPVALVLFTLVLCQVAVLWNSARRRVEVARIVASHKLEDEIVQASIDSVATSPEVQPKAPVIAEEDEDGNKLADRDSSVSGGEEGGHGVETMPLSPAADEHRPISRTGAPCSLRRLYLRWMLLCVVFCTLLVVLVLLFGFLAFLSFNESVTKASRSTSCKILSKGSWMVLILNVLGVDLRFSKICEHNRYGHRSTDSSQLWCYLDYYWASVFKVEYRPHLSKFPMQVAAETPREALPADCRPDFGDVWRLNEGYQVNTTYPCKYNPKKLKMVDIAEEIADKCVLQEPRLDDLIRQFLTLVLFSEETYRAARATGRAFFSGAIGFFLPILMLVGMRSMRCTYYKWRTRRRR